MKGGVLILDLDSLERVTEQGVINHSMEVDFIRTQILKVLNYWLVSKMGTVEQPSDKPIVFILLGVSLVDILAGVKPEVITGFSERSKRTKNHQRPLHVIIYEVKDVVH